MKRFTSFAFSAFSVLLVAGAIAPSAQALPKFDSDFKLHTLRLREMDARNKSEENPQPYYPQADYPQADYPQADYPQADYPQTSTQDLPQNDTAEGESKPAAWESSETQEEDSSTDSLIQQRQQALDRRS